MDQKASVAHEGVIEEITGTLIRVRFVAHSACSACHAKGVCSLSESEVKFADVAHSGAGFSVGERVEVLLEQNQGFLAVWFGYLLPLILLLSVIFTLYALTGKDALSAIAGLGALVPYYVVLYLFRRRISGKIRFRIRKTE